jgi:hypothetical protein
MTDDEIDKLITSKLSVPEDSPEPVVTRETVGTTGNVDAHVHIYPPEGPFEYPSSRYRKAVCRLCADAYLDDPERRY